jgi:hypothetical protein
MLRFEVQSAFAVIRVLVGGEGSVNALYFPAPITLGYASRGRCARQLRVRDVPLASGGRTA